MALARVQATPKTRGTGTSLPLSAFPAPPTVGNGLIVFCNFWRGAGQLPSTCTDNRGNTYLLAGTRDSINAVTGIFYCATIATTGTPFTITLACAPATTVLWVASAVEVSGVGPGLAVDRTAGTTGNSAAPGTGATAALAGSEVVQAAIHAIQTVQSSITVVTATPAWTQEWEELPFDYMAGEADTRIVSSATGTTPSCSWTDTGSNVWAALLVAFSPGAVAAPARAETFVIDPL